MTAIPSRSPDAERPYIGRFAPSPTGPLHFGSLITALASYCDARAHGGQWLIRIEDTDIPRIYPGAERLLLDTLHAFGFVSDQPVVFQKDRIARYLAALDQLADRQLIYACACTRKQLGEQRIYPGHCRMLDLPHAGQAIRLRVDDRLICFDDLLQGRQCSRLRDDLGDFVLRRRDGIISYQLAVMVDDAAQQVTHVVRGADLLDNTARQIWLGYCLDYPSLTYMHLPLAMNDQGQKLSKQNLAQPLDLATAPQLLALAAQALGQAPLILDQPQRMLAQAVAQWDRQALPATQQLPGIYQ